MLKIGIIGSGFGLYGLLPAFNSIKNCQVVCICGERTGRLEKYCASIGLKNIYTNWEDMLKNEELDAVALAVPPGVQYTIAKVAIKKGLHVFAEKPLAANLKQAKELFELAKKEKIVTTVDFIFPEIEQWQKVKQLLNKEIYGKLKNISVAWDFLSYDIKNKISSWKTESKNGGGALSFYFPHSLYYMEYFGGEILSLKSQFGYSAESKNGAEVSVDLLLKFKNGILGQAHIRCNNPYLNCHQLVFVCERAVIVLENKNSHTENFSVKIFSRGQIKHLSESKPRASDKNEDERVKYVKKIATKFVAGCLKNSQVTPSFKEGLRVQELVEKIRQEQI
jgi:predicted dehydrogenase